MVPVDVANQGLVLRVDAERAVETSSELLVIAWLDPRFHYDAEISLVDDRPGKMAQIHGMGFKTYMRDPSLLPPDWREEYNARSARGAEGFSARTILVASVSLPISCSDQNRADITGTSNSTCRSGDSDLWYPAVAIQARES